MTGEESAAAACAPFQFKPSADPRPRAGCGLWFAFRGREMLLGEGLTIPRGDSSAAFGIEPRRVQFIGRCASPTRYHAKARARVCSDAACGLEFFPRLSPAVIVAVERGAEILLARSPHFAPGRASISRWLIHDFLWRHGRVPPLS
jgi:hypothetical protein